MVSQSQDRSGSSTPARWSSQRMIWIWPTMLFELLPGQFGRYLHDEFLGPGGMNESGTSWRRDRRLSPWQAGTGQTGGSPPYCFLIPAA